MIRWENSTGSTVFQNLFCFFWPESHIKGCKTAQGQTVNESLWVAPSEECRSLITKRQNRKEIYPNKITCHHSHEMMLSPTHTASWKWAFLFPLGDKACKRSHQTNTNVWPPFTGASTCNVLCYCYWLQSWIFSVVHFSSWIYLFLSNECIPRWIGCSRAHKGIRSFFTEFI